MDFQTGFDLAMMIVGALVGYIMRGMGQDIKELQTKDQLLLAEVHQVHLIVAGNYVKKDEMKDSFDAVFASLRRIEDTLSNKVDK